MALGKDGSSGQHCYVCDIPRMEWQLPRHKMGELWSLVSSIRCMHVWMTTTSMFVVLLVNL